MLAVDDQKLLNYQRGAEQFQAWLEDQFLHGFAALEADADTKLEQIAARLTDLQLPGPAEAMRRFIGRVGVDELWVQQLTQEFGYWHIQNQLLLNPAKITAEQLGAVLVNYGLRIRKASLEEQQPISAQRYTCMGIAESERSNVYTRRTYWLGETPAMWAEQVVHNYGSPPLATLTQPGDSGEFALYAYPGGLPGRVQLPTRIKLAAANSQPPCYASFAEQHQAHQQLMIAQPWRRHGYLAVENLRLRLLSEELLLIDQEDACISMPLDKDAHTTWRLIATVGEDKFCGYGLLYNGELTLLSIWDGKRLIDVS